MQKSKKLDIKKIKKEVKGITLIALVVTIIVLLILAGVAINLTVGNNGLFTRAQEATDKWEEASKNEEDEMNKVVNFLDEIATKKSEIQIAKEKGNFFDDRNTPLKDDLENLVTIPKGFKVAGDSATKVEDGVVIEDHEGNQFVWIPAKTGAGTVAHTTLGDKTMVYKRTDFGKNNGGYDSYSEIMPSDEETSVNTNGGYYIGRYEAGDKESTDSKVMRKNGTSTSNTVTIKKGQAPYNYAPYDVQKALAEGMDSVRGYEGTTKLTSSYAWDTAISFIQIKNEAYGNSSEEGNYNNTTFEYTDITGKIQTKAKSSSILVPTGQTTPVCNIYDMGGNCYERTTERYSRSSYPVSPRGGNYSSYYADSPAGNRYYNDGNANDNNTFRVTLYL